jgi:hypothetical protein
MPRRAPVPATPPAAQKVKVASTAWDDTVWKCLKFSINEPQFYSYGYSSSATDGTAAIYTATAEGNLDGNTTTSLFELKGAGSTTGDAQRLSLIITNEDE